MSACVLPDPKEVDYDLLLRYVSFLTNSFANIEVYAVVFCLLWTCMVCRA